MQFILTVEEYKALLDKAELAKTIPNKNDLQEVCTKLADNFVLTSGWRKGNVWGCILTVNTEWYCDECPSQKVCPYPKKHWSK